MPPEQRAFLSLRTFPGRLSAEQAGWYLGFNSNEIGVLVSVQMLKPLGHPSSNGTKFFATSALAEMRTEAWLDRASAAIIRFWQKKNASRKKALRPLLNTAA